LGNDDDGPVIISYDALKPDVIIENLVLQGEPVEIFGRGCAMSKRTQGNAITFLTIQQGCLYITLGAFLKKDLMLAAPGEDRRKPAAKS
jgi:hypothetical protein